ncbi:MAG: peptide deformylase [Phycisphaeraceae bacterium]|nr:peptide deformylase [Phycisphaeraceae bacterium]
MAVDPATLQIRQYPDPVLRRRATTVPSPGPELDGVVARMIELMDRVEGIGLAAPQVGLSWRLFVTRVVNLADDEEFDRERVPAEVFLDPVISDPQGSATPFTEGCLSLPDIRGDVLRPPMVTITALDARGERFTKAAGGLVARCWQHENDHLDGVLIIDKFTQMSRLKNRSAIRALERQSVRR